MRWTIWNLLVAGVVLMSAISNAAEKSEPEQIACRLDEFTEAERARSLELGKKFTAAVTEIRELPNGYAFGFGDNAAIFVEAAEWVTLERKCCPFFEFALEWNSTSGAWMELTGDDGVKEFIAIVLIGERLKE